MQCCNQYLLSLRPTLPETKAKNEPNLCLSPPYALLLIFPLIRLTLCQRQNAKFSLVRCRSHFTSIQLSALSSRPRLEGLPGPVTNFRMLYARSLALGCCSVVSHIPGGILKFQAKRRMKLVARALTAIMIRFSRHI